MNQKSPIRYYSFDKFKHKSILYSTVILEKQNQKKNNAKKVKQMNLAIEPQEL